MKKSELKPKKKSIKDNIKSGLIKELKTLTGKFGETTDKLEKTISKGSKKLAKKVAKDIKIVEAPAQKSAPTVKAAKPAVKEARDVKEVKTAKPAVSPAKTVKKAKAAPAKDTSAKADEDKGQA